MYFLGTGGELTHDAGLSVIDEQGNVVFATQAERWTGIKHDNSIPAEKLEEWWKKSDYFAINEDWH